MSSAKPAGWLERYRHILTALLIVAIVGGALTFAMRRPDPTVITIIPPAPTVSPVPTPTPGPIEVYVTGAVQQPESLVTVPYGSRVSDAITAAGGPLEEADMSRVNQAQILRDGDQVHVYAMQEPAVTLATPGDSGVVYINVADEEQLITLPGIGPALAGRIIAYRDANGPFASLEALDQVSGIGPATLADIAPLVSFEIP